MWGSGSRRVGSKISVIFQLRSARRKTQVPRRSVAESASLELDSVVISSRLQFRFSPRFHSWILSCQSQGSPAFFWFSPFLFSSLVIQNGPPVHWHCGFSGGTTDIARLWHLTVQRQTATIRTAFPTTGHLSPYLVVGGNENGSLEGATHTSCVPSESALFTPNVP